jgi:hypothetical protein
MSKMFYPNDGRSAIPFTSTQDIYDYMGDAMMNFGPIEIRDNHVLTQKYGQYIKIGELK